jgi:putative DNA primase/helicase
VKTQHPSRPSLELVKSAFEALLTDLSDAGNANYLVAKIGRSLLFQHDRKKWRYFEDGRWKLDNRGSVLQMTEDVVREAIRDAADYEDKAAVKRFLTHAQNSLNKKKFEAILGMAEAKLPVEQHEFDQDDDALGTLNGVVNLRTGEFRKAMRSDMLTRACGTEYVEDAECPQFLAFLDQIFAGDRALISFIQRAIGYSLTGHTNEQVLFLCHGQGSNGKGVLFSIISALLGDYGLTTPIETFLESRSDRGTNDLAALAGARFVSASEADANRSLAAGRLKMLTGEDPVSARFLFREFFTFEPKFKIWLATNHKPSVRDASTGMWRRLVLIPFHVVFPEHARDPHLRERLIAQELPGILAWAIRGALLWSQDGLQKPRAVLAATKEYREENDRVGAFITERCELAEGYAETSALLYAEYKAWTEATGDKTLGLRDFGTRLDQAGLTVHRTTVARMRQGIRLIPTS